MNNCYLIVIIIEGDLVLFVKVIEVLWQISNAKFVSPLAVRMFSFVFFLDLIHGRVLMKPVALARSRMVKSHGVQISVIPRANGQSTGHEGNDAFDIDRITEFNHVESTVWQMNFQGGFVHGSGWAMGRRVPPASTGILYTSAYSASVSSSAHSLMAATINN